MKWQPAPLQQLKNGISEEIKGIIVNNTEP